MINILTKSRTVPKSAKSAPAAPPSEQAVLDILVKMGEAHAPAIVRASGGSLSLAAIYSLLNRLERKGLVEKRELYIRIGDIDARRVLYKATESEEKSPMG